MKAITVLFSLVLLSSCVDEYNVRLINTRAVVRAYDDQTRNFKPGDTICLQPGNHLSDNRWRVCYDGSMKDTLYSFSYTRADSTVSYNVIEHARGIVQ